MRILHYIPSIDESSGGVGAYMQLLARDLGKLCELHIVTHNEDNERKLENCTIHYIPNKWLPWNNCKKEFLQILNAPERLSPNAYLDVVGVILEGLNLFIYLVLSRNVAALGRERRLAA